MQKVSRRNFLTRSLAAGAFLASPAAFRCSCAADSDPVKLAIIGLGGIDIVGGVGGRGRQLIAQLKKLPAARIVALCDVDTVTLEREYGLLKEQGIETTKYTDLRKVFEDPGVDAVVVATPNHWHGLATVWACQAGKDVYVEKPFSHDIWEGRQMVAAARKYQRIVQVGTQSRSSPVLREAFEFARSGELGPIRSAHALVYRPRESLGTVTEPASIPSSVDYDLWCGPIPKEPPMRKQLHYEWHWFWQTGNGEMGNNGIHVIDLCRWALGHQLPGRALSLGGRLAFNDCGETPNTQIAYLEFGSMPVICEVRNVGKGTDTNTKYRSRNGGVVIDCEKGYVAGESSGAVACDKSGRQIREFKETGTATNVEAAHLASFLSAIRSRQIKDLAAEALQGHMSAACCHIANASYRIGRKATASDIQDSLKGNGDLSDAYERCCEHLRQNGVSLRDPTIVKGPWLTFDATQERFVGDFADQANPFLRREYRKPFEIPDTV